MQQMMQMMGQMFAAPFTIMADTFSRSLHGFSDWSRGGRGGDCGGRDDWERCRDDGWDRGRDRCGDDDGWRDRDRCGDSWSSSGGDWCDRCGTSRDRCSCGDDRCDRCGNSRERCSCGGWKDDDDDDCYRRSCRGYDRRSNRVRLVEYSLVSVARRGGKGADFEPVHGQEVLRDDESRDDFHNWVIAKYARDPEVARNLRVYTRVLDSWCKESWDYDERRLDALREIRNGIDELRDQMRAKTG